MYDPFFDEATPEERPEKPDGGVPLAEMDRLIKEAAQRHKRHCDGALGMYMHMDGAAWFGTGYKCEKCGTTVYVQLARKKSRRYAGYNEVEIIFPEGFGA